MNRGGERTLLTVDRGNTTLDCRLMILRDEQRMAVRRARLSDAGAEALEDFLAGASVHAAAGCTVVAGGLDATVDVLRRRAIDLRIAGRDLPCPLAIGYRDARELGVDRWVAAVAARERYGDALVVDCGTAFTMGVVRRDGSYQPGPIGPGLGTLTRALAERAPALPQFDRREPDSWPPEGTLDAVRAGVGRGFVRSIESLARELLAAAGCGPGEPVRIATGGDAAIFVAMASPGWIERPELVHDGLLWLLERCVSRS